MLRFLSTYLQKKLSFASQPVRQYTQNEKLQILKENHDLAQHLGENKTIARIKDQHYWTNIDTDVQTYIQNCDVCQRTKLMRIRLREEAIITGTPDEPNDKVAMDIIGLPTSHHSRKPIYLVNPRLPDQIYTSSPTSRPKSGIHYRQTHQPLYLYFLIS